MIHCARHHAFLRRTRSILLNPGHVRAVIDAPGEFCGHPPQLPTMARLVPRRWKRPQCLALDAKIVSNFIGARLAFILCPTLFRQQALR